MEEKYTRMLLDILKEKLKGREKHPLYYEWINEEMEIVEAHNKHLIPDIERFVDLSDKCILDFGCGTAGSSVALALRGARVVGVEPNFLSVKSANIRTEGHHLNHRVKVLHIENTSELPFADRSFDLCVCYSVLEYIPNNREQYLREIWRILKKQGMLFIGGTSNGIYPLEMHSKKWFVNYFPKVASKHNLIHGSSYWEITSALKPFNFSVLNKANKPDGLDIFIQRASYQSLDGLGSLKKRVLILLLKLLRVSICPFLGIPIDAFLPWLNICLKKM